tara:strand:+ start:2391 stop:3659 length:1269 start_codon:yes stop_codon:yes gene_type:complete
MSTLENKSGNFGLETLAIGIAGEDELFDISHLVALKYVEDIKSSSIRCEITLTDTGTGALSDLQGLEPVYIKFIDNKEGDDHVIEKNLQIYDIQDRVVGKQSKATLLCCSPDLINNAALKISRRYGAGKGDTIDKIVAQDILEDILGVDPEKITIEKTENNISFISPYWCPFTMIAWLCTKAVPQKETGSGSNASAGYCFFENKFGYSFVSYDQFAKQADEPVHRFMVGYEADELEQLGNKVPIDSMKVLSSSDVLQGLNYGSYCSTVLTLDMKDMKYTPHPFNINKYWSSVPKMNKDAVTPAYFTKFTEEALSTRIMSKIIDTRLFTEGTFTGDFTKQISQSALREKLFYNKKVEINFVGDLSHKVGDVVELYSSTGGRDQQKDTANSGMYVVGRIEREYHSKNDRMDTKIILYTDSPGIE